MTEKEGVWAREYRQGRAEQVKQQKIANLIAAAQLPQLASVRRRDLADRAYAALTAVEREEQP